MRELFPIGSKSTKLKVIVTGKHSEHHQHEHTRTDRRAVQKNAIARNDIGGTGWVKLDLWAWLGQGDSRMHTSTQTSKLCWLDRASQNTPCWAQYTQTQRMHSWI